jgi:ferritin-like metal-binding protein YciE
MARRKQRPKGPVIDTEDLAQLQAARTMVLQYLDEAYATEQALVTNLRAHLSMTPRGAYRQTLERHLAETQQHARALAQRVGELGAGRGLLASTYGVVQTLVGQALVLTKGPLDLIRGAGGEEKLLKNAKDEAATEMLEIATYDALEELARAVGDEKTARLAVRHREQEERALRELRGHIVKLTHATVMARAGGEPSYEWETTGAAEGVEAVGDATQGSPRVAAEPPIADYDSLTASRVVTRLTDLSQNELRRVIVYERAHRDRSTVLDRARSLQESEPFPGYDELAGRDVTGRLRDADEETVTAAREYEGRHKRRVEVLEAVQRQLSSRS